MLPSLRFLVAAIAVSASVLIFGFGAAAILRAAREDVNTISAWRQPQQSMASIRFETTPPPSLALLRVEPAQPEAARLPETIVEPQSAAVAPFNEPPTAEQAATIKPEEPKPTSAPQASDQPTASAPASQDDKKEIKQASLDPAKSPAEISATAPEATKIEKKKRRSAKASQRRKIAIARARIIRSAPKPADAFPPLFGGT